MSDDISVRRAAAGEEGALLECLRAAYGPERRPPEPGAIVAGAFLGDEPAGAATATTFGDLLVVQGVAVRSEFRRRGVGARLVTVLTGDFVAEAEGRTALVALPDPDPDRIAFLFAAGFSPWYPAVVLSRGTEENAGTPGPRMRWADAAVISATGRDRLAQQLDDRHPDRFTVPREVGPGRLARFAVIGNEVVAGFSARTGSGPDVTTCLLDWVLTDPTVRERTYVDATIFEAIVAARNAGAARLRILFPGLRGDALRSLTGSGFEVEGLVPVFRRGAIPTSDGDRALVIHPVGEA